MIRSLVVALMLALSGCASLVTDKPIVTQEGKPIEAGDAKYIEAETLLRSAYRGLGQLAKQELDARAQGKQAGSVISRGSYFQALDRLDTLTEVVRQGRNLVGDGSCLEMETFKDLNIKGCLKREQIALLVLNILETQ